MNDKLSDKLGKLRDSRRTLEEDPRSSEEQQREAARVRLQNSIDLLTEKTDLHLKMQVEPIKMIGGSAGGGFLLGFLLGRRGRKIKKVFVERAKVRNVKTGNTTEAHFISSDTQKGIGAAITGILVTTLLKIAQEQFLSPFLERYTETLLEKTKKDQKQGKTTVIPPRR
jgi:ElaB/YqjD/DUF883 family membrane-anchored ribosome-binding protein